ncbi:hypothetical protein AMAG_18708 [Allomyces macrogynus ATCC 38327]|uniref:Uncharacterized protein n=1 Tax=Allomyces macrogynus (strain ATCC 38327) TaxID=578462 RepID=A0A0L0SEF4_ALLM3|nr:hypothetical protein AMAG_18708 [Allomyces macrogynus ATCC 38327]|eukprot:KNE60913.1 hypothetical protein AMAG_18708 [Allomyces macrogynus ATCC 38327]
MAFTAPYLSGRPAMALFCEMATITKRIMFLVGILFACVSVVQAGWPQGHQRKKALLSPGLIHLPKENKTFVLGGRIRLDATTTEYIDDVAMIDLNQIVTSNDISAQAVSVAPFKLPEASYRHSTFVIDNGKGAYDAWIFAPGNTSEIWRIFDLQNQATIAPQPVKEKVFAFFPAYISSSDPRPSNSDTYFFGNTTANGQEISTIGNDTLWRFNKQGLSRVTYNSQMRPPGRGWSSMVQSGSSLVLTGSGPIGNDIWMFSTISWTWSQRGANLTVDRADHAMVSYDGPDNSRFVIVVGGSSGSIIEYFDAVDTSKDAIAGTLTGDGTSTLLGASSVFLHDSHLFIVGGLVNADGDGQLLSIIKITPTRIANGFALNFAWVPTYTPAGVLTNTNTTMPPIVEKTKGIEPGTIVGHHWCSGGHTSPGCGHTFCSSQQVWS